MTFVERSKREINCKIVYCGPARGGKVENLEHIYNRTDPSARGKLTSLATETDRTVFFHFLLDSTDLRGFRIRFHLHSDPLVYHVARKLVMKDVDGIVFVADSQKKRMNENVETLEDLQQFLKSSHGYDLKTIPYVLQLNKRDHTNIVSVDEMKKRLVLKGEPVIEAVANHPKGTGVSETLAAVVTPILQALESEETSALSTVLSWLLTPGNWEGPATPPAVGAFLGRPTGGATRELVASAFREALAKF